MGSSKSPIALSRSRPACIPPLNAQYQPNWMNPFPNAKGEFLFQFLRIEIGSKYTVPNSKQRPQVVHVVVRIIAMVDLMVSGCHKDPLNHHFDRHVTFI